MVGSSERGSHRALAGSRTLDAGDFSFYRFGELRREELRKILRLGIRNDVPAVTVADGAHFIPGGFDPGPEQPKFDGGLVYSDGRPIEAALTHRKGGKRVGGLYQTVSVAPEQDVDEPIIYLGLLYNHYGRLLLESLSRAWYLRQADPALKVVFHSANAAQTGFATWVLALLEAFGVPESRMLKLNTPARLSRAIVPESLFEQMYAAHPEVVRPFRDVAARFAGDVQPTDQPLYLSRRLLSSRQRPIVGEVELEELLASNGFRIAHPETMTIDEQVRLINGHRNIFSSLGSAAHTVLFALHRPRLHLLANRDDIPANYFLCSALAEAPTTFVNCLGAGGRPSPNDERVARRELARSGQEREQPAGLAEAGPQAMPQMIDLAAVADYLREIGLLATPGRGTDPSAVPLQARFDEAWLYARVRKATSKVSALPEDIKREAREVSRHSWPVSLMLARYYARMRDDARTDEMVNQWADLITSEEDALRLRHYRGDAVSTASRVARNCRPETNQRFSSILRDRFEHAKLLSREGAESSSNATDDASMTENVAPPRARGTNTARVRRRR